jgi:hypothetical protein
MRVDLVTKLLIGSGTLLMLASMIGTYTGIYSSFSALKMNETAGIGAVGGALSFALVSSVAFFIGMLLLIIGVVRLLLKNRPPK